MSNPWPTTISVRDASAPIMAGAALSLGLGGLQTRNLADIGWIWSEVMATFNVNTRPGRALMNRVARAWNEGEVFTKLHPDLKVPLGAGALGSTPKVNGNNQRGTSLITDGWPANTLVLAEGDPIRVGILRPVFRMRADVTSDNAGNAILPINPLILVGSEPFDEDLITWTGVAFNCVLGEAPDFASARAGPSGHMAGLVLTFFEALG